MKKTTIFIIILISLVLIIGLPLAIDWLIIGNGFPSNIENSDWVSFFGGYIGALIGAIVSLAGIIITIRYTNEQNKKDRELQVRPYCAMRFVHDDKLVGTKRIIAQLPIGCEPRENNGPKYTGIIYIKNIGLGAACPIYMYFNFDKITEDDFLDLGESEMSRYIVKHEVMHKYKNFDIVLHIKYQDLFMNTYYQKITLSSNIHVGGKMDEKQANYLCDINLKEITTPVKI